MGYFSWLMMLEISPVMLIVGPLDYTQGDIIAWRSFYDVIKSKRLRPDLTPYSDTSEDPYPCTGW
jgi:hypothetical protein